MIPRAKRYGRALLVAGVVCVLLAAAAAWGAEGVFRFPRPEFESGYQLPAVLHPATRPALMPWVDIAVLAGALALASYLALRRRSRRALFVLTIFSVLYFGFFRKGCICAVGSVQNVVLGLSDPSYIIPVAALAFFVLPLLLALFFGRTFCAAVCPLGAIQEIVIWKPCKVPRWLEQALGMIPVLYLGTAVLLAAAGAGFVICRYDPFVGFFRFGANPGMLAAGAVLLVTGMFVARPYCRYLCPYGVLLGWASRISRRHVTITPDECVVCGLCEDVCPVGAILPPVPERAPETRARGIRRLGMVLCLAPLCILAGGWVGARLDVPLSRAHATVRLAERVALEDAGGADTLTLESDAFRRSGRATDALIDDALRTRAGFRLGGAWLGALAGLLVAGKLVALCLRRTRKEYAVDHAACVSCGRCFLSCPREQQRIKAGKTR